MTETGSAQPQPEAFEAWRLVLVGRLILNTAAIVLNLINCLLLGKLARGRKSHTSILSLLYLSYAELAFAVTSQLFSVLFLASHSSQEEHTKTSPLEHNKVGVLAALASSGSLKHSSLFLRQWWVLALVLLHCLTKRFGRFSARLAGRGFVRLLYWLLAAVGVSFGVVRLVAEKIPEYFRKTYISSAQHEVIHRVLFVLEFGMPPLLTLPCCVALAFLLTRRCRSQPPPLGDAKEDDLHQLQPMPHHAREGLPHLQQHQPSLQVTWSWKNSQVTLAIGLLFTVCQGPLVLLDREGAEAVLYINLQDLLISLYGCSHFVVLCWASVAFRRKLGVMCTCNVTPGTADQADTVLDSCCEMVDAQAV